MLYQHFLGDHLVQLVVHHFQEFDYQLDLVDYQQQVVECQSCVIHHPFELEGYELQPIVSLFDSARNNRKFGITFDPFNNSRTQNSD